MIRYDPQHRIVWIASFPRSGNTWVRTFLYALYNVFRDPNYNAIDLNKMGRFSAWDNSMPLYRKYIRGPLNLVSPRAIAELRPKVMKDIMATSRGAVLVKTHNARVIDIAPIVDPEITAGAIYLVRNPLDVAISFAEFQSAPLDVAIAQMADKELGQTNNPRTTYTSIGSWTGNVRSWTDKADPTTLVLRYEDMLEDPEKAFGAIAEHMMMRPSPEQLTKAVGLSSFDKLRGSEEQSSFEERPETAKTFFRSGKHGQWRDTLSAQQVDKVVAAHGKLMERYGYLP